jgi:threonine/homoserine/homoserine lactone efflux protein
LQLLAVVALLFCILALAILGAMTSKTVLHQAMNVIFILLGIVFLYVGLKAWLSRSQVQGDTAPSRLQRATQGSVAHLLVFLVIVLLIFGWTVVVVAALGGKPAIGLLSRFGNWLRAHERPVSAMTGVVIGLLFLLRGLASLRGGA